MEFKLSVKAVIEDGNGRCLLVRRSGSSKHYAGQWEWPGGKVDPGEDFAVATCRETKEETNLDIQLTSLAGAAEFTVGNFQVIALCMNAEVVSGEVKLSDEHDEYAWVAWDELGKYDLAENTREFMLDFAKGR